MTIPPDTRAEIALDPFMRTCIYVSDNAPNKDCYGRVEWEHAWIYAGKQIQEVWAIVPCCTSHNRGKGIVKSYNQYRSIIRADLDDLKKRYPKRNWDQDYLYLTGMYETK